MLSDKVYRVARQVCRALSTSSGMLSGVNCRTIKNKESSLNSFCFAKNQTVGG